MCNITRIYEINEPMAPRKPNPNPPPATEWTRGDINGVTAKYCAQNQDCRGWLMELFRDDELVFSRAMTPMMAYMSMTEPGVQRGPHEHMEQADLFVFIQGVFEIGLWDNRPESSTYKNFRRFFSLTTAGLQLYVPPGVVHVYKNVGSGPGLVFNAPDQLYAGVNKLEQVDEIRHEKDPTSPFNIDISTR